RHRAALRGARAVPHRRRRRRVGTPRPQLLYVRPDLVGVGAVYARAVGVGRRVLRAAAAAVNSANEVRDLSLLLRHWAQRYGERAAVVGEPGTLAFAELDRAAHA